MQVKKTITSLTIVLALVQCAKAEEVISQSGFTTGTSFERLENGALHAGMDDSGGYTGSNYWETASAVTGDPIPGTYVTDYGAGEAYRYATTTRNGLFKGTNGQYLALDLESTLHRRIMPGNVQTNILLRKLTDGIYADTLVKLTPCVSAPDLDADGTDKIVVWLRESDREVGTATNLVVTAGRYADGLGKVERCDYVIEDPLVKADTWCRLTIRMIDDITGVKDGAGDVRGVKAAAFTVYVDGELVRADADYDIGFDGRSDSVLPEARVLIAERRLFPCLAPAGYDGSTSVSHFSFDGQGAVDDVVVTTERPGHVVSGNVFTLNWDAGVLSMTCVVSNAAGVVTNEIAAAELPRFRDFVLGADNYAQVTVTNVVCDTARGYSNGVWRAENDCTVSGNVFTYDGKSANPIGIVASSRNVIEVGSETGCATFAEAKVRARKAGTKTIALLADTVISVAKTSAGYKDGGVFSVVDGDDLILDLCGHTLQGGVGNPTIRLTGGRLVIMDSSEGKTGRVMPYELYAQHVAVKSETRSMTVVPALTLEAGWYDGYVVITNSKPDYPLGTCAISGGSFTNAHDTTERFYLDQYVADPSLYYGLSAENYWTTVAEGCIWTGKGSDARWSNGENWKGNAVLGADDLAIFPRKEDGGGWPVDFGEGVATKRLWLDADIVMAGTNEFSDVTVVSGSGRVTGTGTVAFTGRLPGVLTAAGSGTEIRLGEDWKGTVRIAKVAKAQPLTNIMGWGNAESKVEFAGVRGYLSDRANYALPYGLVLTDADDGATPAWQNDTGYTGSIVSFPSLEGTGTFKSPKNTREIMQVFQFRNVEAFRGRFDLGGKRLLLGSGAVAKKATAGDFTFADAVRVCSGLDWSGVSAHFGSQLGVFGAFGQKLMTFTGTAPDVSGVKVTLTDAQGNLTVGRLKIDGNAVLVVAADAFMVNGKSVAAMEVASVVRDGYFIDVPAGSALAISGNDVIVNGKIVASVSDNYTINAVSPTRYAVSFNAAQVTPTLASFTVDASGGKAVIQVSNAKSGFWYGLQTISSLAERWDANPTEWKRASDEGVTFEPTVGDASSFYRVIMTDRDPNGGEE